MSTRSPYPDRVINSALWSAYGDALGFITELRDNERAIYARIGTERVTHTVPWKRRVGGKFGAEAVLLAGCYSDDTQLRLATSRAIRPDASFNIEAFAKMELPVWTSYALGAGRGTKAAATRLAQEGVTWFSNFYESETATYIKGGGNGAAMRIQPHVWAARPGASFQELAGPIIRNAVSTHGHPRGIIGAMFHAMCLDHARRTGAAPTKDVWKNMIGDLHKLPGVIETDPDLKTFWLPVWEQKSSTTFRDACTSVQKEMLNDVEVLQSSRPLDAKEVTYRAAIHEIGAIDQQERGSGTKTALLAAFLADLFREEGPHPALLCAANCLPSDTDTIATMAGAIMGITVSDGPPGELLDKSYIAQQAERLATISQGELAEQTNYPNLLNWKPPRTQQDSVVVSNNRLEVLILGKVAQEGPKFETGRPEPSLWQWLSLESGQTILAKRRKIPMQMNNQQRTFVPYKPLSPAPTGRANQPHLPLAPISIAQTDPSQSPNVDDLTRRAINSQFDPKMIGEHLLVLSSLSNGVDLAIGYAAIIAKARSARSKQNK